MLIEIVYDRTQAVSYAEKWAFGRNPRYYNFDDLGGDCTNFISQCIYAGCNVMNFTPDTGWYYSDINNRAAAWTGVEFLYRFLTNNNGAGPYAEPAPLSDVNIGDVIQLGASKGEFYHSCLVVGFAKRIPLVAAHTNNAFNIPLTEYYFENFRCLKILGARKFTLP